MSTKHHRDSAHTFADDEAPLSSTGGNGNGEHTPVGDMTDEQFRLLPQSEQTFRAYKASLYSQEQARETRGAFELVAIAANRAANWSEYASKRSDAALDEAQAARNGTIALAGRVETIEQYAVAMKTSITTLASQLSEFRKLDAEARDRFEGRVLQEFGAMGTRIDNLTVRLSKNEVEVERVAEAAEEAEGWASKSGQHHMTELQMRASKGEALMEQIALRTLAADDERRRLEAEHAAAQRKAEAEHLAAQRKADLELAVEKRRASVKTWSAFAAAVISGIGVLIVAFAERC